MSQYKTTPANVVEEIGNDECVLIVVCNPKNHGNIIEESEANLIRERGRQIVEAGLREYKVTMAIASRQPRSVQTAELLLEGIEAPLQPVAQSHFLNSIDEVDDKIAEAFQAAAIKAGMEPNQALSEKRGQQLVARHGLPSRFTRASRVASTWTAIAQTIPGYVGIVSDHSGYDIEPAIAYLIATAEGNTMITEDDLPDPEHYLGKAGVVAIKFNRSGDLTALAFIDE